MNFQLKVSDAIPPGGTVLAYVTANDLVAALTILFTLCKLYEWVESRIEKRRKKKDENWTGI